MDYKKEIIELIENCDKLCTGFKWAFNGSEII